MNWENKYLTVIFEVSEIFFSNRTIDDKNIYKYVYRFEILVDIFYN